MNRAGRPNRVRLVVGGAVLAALAIFVAANGHLIYVAFASQPGCVAHLKEPGGGGFRAAKPAC